MDLRKPGINKLFNLPNGAGLTSLLRSDEVGIDDVAQETEEDNLRPAGRVRLRSAGGQARLIAGGGETACVS